MKDCVYFIEWGNEIEYFQIMFLKMYVRVVVKVRVEFFYVLEEVVGVYGKREKEIWIKYVERVENEGVRVR